MPTHQPAQTRKLSADQRLLMIEWISDDLTNDGIAAHIEHWNRTHEPGQSFPTLTPSAISYWRRKFKTQVQAAQRAAMNRYQEAIQRGLRNREKRIDWLIVAAELLIPYLGEANVKGEFSASVQFAKLIAQVTEMVDGPQTTSTDSSTLDLSALSIEQLQALKAAVSP